MSPPCSGPITPSSSSSGTTGLAASSSWGGSRTRLLDDGSAGPGLVVRPSLTQSDDVEEPPHADSSLPGVLWPDQTRPGFRGTTRRWINNPSNALPSLRTFEEAQ